MHRLLRNIARKLSAKAICASDVLVVGGGHAGCEAATAAARTGVSTVLLTHREDTIGEMSCNPSFGGIGKGHLIREVDAMDGVCGRICDQAAITYQALNVGQGPAVLGLRAQIDRSLYKRHMRKEIVENTPNLRVIEGSVEDLAIERAEDGSLCVAGVRLEDGRILLSKSVVITTGTFLGGQVFRGMKKYPAGRIGEKSSTGLSKTLNELGFKLGRLRTGTPPRLLKRTIDFNKFTTMPPDRKPIPFSFLTDRVWLDPSEQLPTYLSYTNDRVAQLVHDNFHNNEYIRSEANGPRYCPSLEAKILKFANMHHRVFLEHEGLESELIYPQGMSMTFQPEVQLQIMRAIPGLENVEITEAGYGVEYDFVNPQQLHPSLETKIVKRLLFAGQINGTTGYEEAAAQGVVAGINASALSRGKECLLIDRTEGYIGVLIDDLTSLGTSEPYRMFTSRAEFRLHLRPDNADMRLTEKAYRAGAVSEHRYARFCTMRRKFNDAVALLKSIEMPISRWKQSLPGFTTKKGGGKVLSAYEMLHRFDISMEQLAIAFPNELNKFVGDEQLESRIRNEGIYAQQHGRLTARMEEVRRECATLIPENTDYATMDGLSFECKEKFETWRPQNLAAASRIPGITPEALCVLLRYLKTPTRSSLSAAFDRGTNVL
uniref:Protein MTO1 homolog, mitochondrial n=1 Tax=Parascaris univalens TaxID=6257 RepID=A0A915AZ10_PARUN